MSFWDEQVELGTVERDEKGNCIKVTKCKKGSQYYIDIRNYFVNKQGEVAPTRKGIAIPADYVKDVADILQDSLDEVLTLIQE